MRTPTMFLLAALAVGCAGEDDSGGAAAGAPPDGGAPITGIELRNESQVPIQHAYSKACGEGSFANDLLGSGRNIAPGASITLPFEPGCYDLAVASNGSATDLVSKSLPNVKVRDGEAVIVPVRDLTVNEAFAARGLSCMGGTGTSGAPASDSLARILTTQIVRTTGRSDHDEFVNGEVRGQAAFWNTPTTVVLFNEGGEGNASAMSWKGAQGPITFGLWYYWMHFRAHGYMAIQGILAHEWAHQVQFRQGFADANTTRDNELEADAFSGYYLRLSKAQQWEDIKGYIAHRVATGDYEFKNESHHGTPNQRTAAVGLGVQVADWQVQNKATLTYAQMHDAFIGEIRKWPLGGLRAGGLAGLTNAEMPLPRATEAERLALRPAN